MLQLVQETHRKGRELRWGSQTKCRGGRGGQGRENLLPGHEQAVWSGL